ncbi:ribonuclease H-like domain-containing protein [Tanacetum coccineum]
MSETEPIPPTSSVTALRIPIIKKGEYDLWSMKMRQYIAITDHILWDIITNGNQTTTDPASPSVSAPKTSLAANARRNNEKALNILLSAIPDRHLLSFHDAVDARSLWKAIKARFGGNEASKKMQKNLLKQQFETFTIGSREELDSAYERFQHILSMLELHDATVSIEDANLKFLRSLPSVWHVVATMIRGQPGLDELDFDDLYNNLKVYEHELKGVSNSNSQNIAFLSTEVKGSTLKQSTAEPAHIPKGYTQAISSKVPTAPNCVSHSDEIICSFFAQQASMPTTHDDEDLLQIDEDAMEEIDIRWQVAMITARIRKFMRKTGRSIDLKPKNGITFDKSKIECFNCQKLGHFARECRFAKYQENITVLTLGLTALTLGLKELIFVVVLRSFYVCEKQLVQLLLILEQSHSFSSFTSNLDLDIHIGSLKLLIQSQKSAQSYFHKTPSTVFVLAGDLYKLLLMQDMAAPTILISAEENIEDPIDIRVDIIHPEPVAAVAFPATAVVRTQAQHGEAIRGILEHLQGVSIEEKMSTLRFRMGMVEAENTSLRSKIKTIEAIETVTHSQEKRAHMEMNYNNPEFSSNAKSTYVTMITIEGPCHAESNWSTETKESQTRICRRYDQEGYTEGEVEDRVMLKVSPWKGVVRFGKRGKLNPRYVGPVLAKVGAIAYKLELP